MDNSDVNKRHPVQELYTKYCSSDMYIAQWQEQNSLSAQILIATVSLPYADNFCDVSHKYSKYRISSVIGQNLFPSKTIPKI